MSYVQTNQNILVPNQNYVVNESDTGKIFILPQTTAANDITLTLPNPLPGLHYYFINGSPAAAASNVNITATGTICFGQASMGPIGGVSTISIAGAPPAGLTTLTFVTAVSVLGDFADYYCDGTNWYINANSRTTGSFVAA